MSDRILQLASILAEPIKSPADDNTEEKIEVSLPARSAGKLYEKARLAIDYQEEHLLRRNAIIRIIKRYAGSDTTISQIADRLIRELIWAQYLPNKQIPVSFTDKLIMIFDKYEPLLRSIDDFDEVDKDYAFDWLLEALSTEIEYALSSPIHEEATVSYMYEEMRERIEWDERYELTDEQKDLFTYIAVHKALLKSDLATLRFRVMSIYYPNWPGDAPKHLVHEIESNLLCIMETVDNQIQNEVVEKLTILLRRRSGLFRTFTEAISEKPQELPGMLSHPEKIDKLLIKALKIRTAKFRNRLRRTVLRSVTLLLITKALSAIIFEFPYQWIFTERENYAPVIVNIFFTPFLLAILALTVSIPQKRNEADYISALRALLVGADHNLINIRMKVKRISTLDIMFNLFYLITYLIVYGGTAIILHMIGFHWLSNISFLIFLSLVAFLGIRIRLSTKDIIINEARRGIFGFLFDFFMIPVVRFGRWLSVNVQKINVFVYFFDFILEAPIKVAIRVFDSWTDFIHEKREEL